MSKKRSKTPSKLPPGMCEIRLKVPPSAAAALRAHVTADNSISSLIRDIAEDVFGEGKPAPADLDVMTPKPNETWARISTYCSEKTRDRGMTEVKRRELDRKGTRKPLGIAPALTWLIVQRYENKPLQ